MTGIVIYKSRYGAAKQYAEWIARELGIAAIGSDEVKAKDFVSSDYIVVGSSIYMGKILIKNWLEKNGELLKGKRLFLFIVGAAPPLEQQKTKKYFSDNVSKEMLNQAQCFYLQGKSVFKELSWSDKFFLKIGAMLVKEASDKKAMLTDFNAIKKENVTDLVSAVKSLK